MLRVGCTRLISQRSNVALSRNLASDKTTAGSGTTQPPRPVQSEVPGLTNNVVNVPNHAVGFAGSTKSSEYKNPEYFCYHVDSFGESFVEMEKFRLPAPSSKAKK